MTQQDRFRAALQRLVDWHRDSLAARDYNAPSGGGKPGSRVLRSQFYPGLSHWMAAWRRCQTEIEQEAVIHALDAEYGALSRRPRVEIFRDYWGKTRYRVVTAEATDG